MDFDPRDCDPRARDDFDIYDARWLDDPRDQDGRARDFERDHDLRGHDPRDPFLDGLELPRGLERELVANPVAELDGWAGRTGLARLAVGSVAAAVGRHARCPVVLAPPSQLEAHHGCRVL